MWTPGEKALKSQQSCSEFTYIHYWLLPAVTCSLIVAFFQKQHRECGFEHAVGFLPLPVRFLSTHSKRWGFALAFGAIINMILEKTIEGDIYQCFQPPAWATVLVHLLISMELAMVHYPLFICLTVENRVVGGLIGCAYSLAWFIYQIIIITNQYTKETPLKEFLYTLPFPTLICNFLLVLRFIFTSIKASVRRNSTLEQAQTAEFPVHTIMHVKRLLQPSGMIFEQKSWFRRTLYDWDSCFRFTAGMIVMAVVSVNIVYTTSCQLMVWFIHINACLNGTILEFFVGKGKYIGAVFLTAMALLGHILSIMSTYRTQMKQLYQGDGRSLPSKLPCSDVVVVKSISYIGVQLAAFIISSGIFCSIFYCGLVLLEIILIVPFRELLTSLGIMLANALPVIIISVVLRFTAHLLLLQDRLSPSDKHKPLALCNVPILENIRYFALFCYMCEGVVQSTARILIRFIIGCLSFPRLDRATLPMAFSPFVEFGYWSWLSMLLVDFTHTNPTALCFCHILTKQLSKSNKTTHAQRRWLLTYSLLKNQSLVLLRKHRLVKNTNSAADTHTHTHTHTGSTLSVRDEWL